MPELNRPSCLLVCVGSELLCGKLNTHASFVSRRLASLGLALNEENTVGDEAPDIAAAIRRGLARFEVVLVSGGLGPTFDDLTREAASEATGRPLRLSPVLLRDIRTKFKRAHYRMPASNARQAYLLKGAEAIVNKVGTAPGQWLDLGGRVLILLPGPPSELYPMMELVVLPRLKRLSRGVHLESHMHFVGVPESVIDHKVRPIIEKARARAGAQKIQFTILAHLGLVDLDIFVGGPAVAQAQRTLSRIVKQVRAATGEAWYGSDKEYPLEKIIGDRLRRQDATIAVAESCTGGLLAARLTDIAGSSDYFLQGWVVYTDAAKRSEVGVPLSVLQKHGAVSRPVALALARGARERAGATWGVGITGIAGPGGGTPAKPVGLVFIAMASKGPAVCRAFNFSGNRDAIRQRSVLAALDLLRQIR